MPPTDFRHAPYTIDVHHGSKTPQARGIDGADAGARGAREVSSAASLRLDQTKMSRLTLSAPLLHRPCIFDVPRANTSPLRKAAQLLALTVLFCLQSGRGDFVDIPWI
jgi:hypothetical protein